jgi:predicted CXXCH cytochrome family protein
MTHSNSTMTARLAALLVGAVVAASCTSEKIAYKSEPAAAPPPTAAANFVGYQDTLTKQTVCGNCHVDQQAAWVQTHHANAWSDLQASGHATAACVACHTVNSYGNSATDTLVGFLATKDPRYQDVQCESCHGPGLVHVTAPSLANLPLPSINVDTGAAFGNGCGECHTGVNNPYVDEWVKSAHGNSIETGATCVQCHTGQGALAAWGVNTNYVEATQLATNPMNITCAVCHNPHGGPNVAQLRWPINVPDTAGMLCMKCHQRNSKPVAPASSHAPMSPEGPVLLGFAGWFPPSYTGPDTITLTHGTVSANPGLCVTCHVVPKRVTNAAGTLVDNYTGHLFLGAPCLDANGVPTTGSCDITQRDFTACAASGCHGAPSVAMSLMSTVTARLALLDSALNSQIVQIPASQFSSTTMNTAIGAKFNLQLAEKVGEEVHNPFLMEALLTASIQQIQLDYKIAPKVSVDLANILPAMAKK